MGLFSKLFHHDDENVDDVQEYLKQRGQSQTEQKNTSYVRPPKGENKEKWMAYFRGMIQATYPGVELRENVSPEQLGLHAAANWKDCQGQFLCRMIDFCIMKDGEPKAIVMVTEHNTDIHADFKNTRDTVVQSQLAFVNFFMQMPNEPDYVQNRLHAIITAL